MFPLDSCATVNPVILSAFWRNLQTVAHHEGGLAEIKPRPERLIVSDFVFNTTFNFNIEAQQLNVTTPVKIIIGLDEEVQLLIRILYNIFMQFNTMIHTKWPWKMDTGKVSDRMT